MTSELNGPSLFPRTIRLGSDFAGAPLLGDAKNLEAVHNIMKSLELKSPEKIMNEAKKIVDGGLDLLQSDLTSFAETADDGDAIAPKRKDRPQERRQGLGLARKRAPFSLKNNASLSSVSLEPTLNIDQLQDPDEFFDAYETMENAKREIQKQMGNLDNFDFDNYKPSTQARERRPGMLGKSYKNKHRFSSTTFPNDDLISSQETTELDIPGSPKDDLEDQSASIDPNPDVLVEEDGLDVQTKKTAGEFSEMLEDLLSCSNDDLEGDGALNILQERLKIKPLDLDKLCMPDISDAGLATKLIVGETLQSHQRSPLTVDDALKSLNRRHRSEHENVPTPVSITSSPTPPRSPFASLQLLKKKILQTNPLRDPFSPLNINSSAPRNMSPVQPMPEFHEQVDVPKDLGMTKELDSHVGNVEDRETSISNMETEKVIQTADDHDYVDNDRSTQNILFDVGRNDTSTIEKTMEVLEEQSNPSDVEETLDNASIRQHDLEQKHEAHQAKARRSKRKASETARIKKAQPQRKAKLANPSEVEGTVDSPAIQRHDILEQQQEACQANAQRGKGKAGESRIRKSHPMRKSLAESGTTFEDGVRRSKRIRTRPLEYWKGERFLYGRVNDGLKLVGVNYISPGKDSDNLKYVSSESSEFRKLLKMEASH